MTHSQQSTRTFNTIETAWVVLCKLLELGAFVKQSAEGLAVTYWCETSTHFDQCTDCVNAHVAGTEQPAAQTGEQVPQTGEVPAIDDSAPLPPA